MKNRTYEDIIHSRDLVDEPLPMDARFYARQRQSEMPGLPGQRPGELLASYILRIKLERARKGKS
jgi:hypothetical protein